MTALPPPPDGHDHPRPDTTIFWAVFDPARELIPPDWTINDRPLRRLIAARDEACKGCETMVSRWWAAHGDPHLVVLVAGLLVLDMAEVCAWVPPSALSSRELAAELLRLSYGRSCMVVLEPLLEGDPEAAAAAYAALEPGARLAVLESVLHGLWNPPRIPLQPEASWSVRPTVGWERPVSGATES